MTKRKYSDRIFQFAPKIVIALLTLWSFLGCSKTDKDRLNADWEGVYAILSRISDPKFPDRTFHIIDCGEANVDIFAVGNPNAALDDICLNNIKLSKGNTAFYIRYFNDFNMNNVVMANKRLPMQPEKDMEKPTSLEMGW